MASFCLALLQRVSHDLIRFNDGRNMPPSLLDSLIVSLEIAYRELIVLDLTEELSLAQKEGVDIVRSCLITLREVHEFNLFSENPPITLVSRIGIVGRPRYEIPEHNLRFLLENRFTVPQIARMIGVSISTIRRRMHNFGFSVRALYSDISDTELDVLVKHINQDHPMCGSVQMMGHLISKGYRLQQIRIRESLRRIDPIGTALRRLHVMNRRHYSVPSPLSLFHIDGHHKLIR